MKTPIFLNLLLLTLGLYIFNVSFYVIILPFFFYGVINYLFESEERYDLPYFDNNIELAIFIDILAHLAVLLINYHVLLGWYFGRGINKTLTDDNWDYLKWWLSDKFYFFRNLFK